MQQYILDIREPLREFYKRTSAGTYAVDDVDDMIDQVWYALHHKSMTNSILMDLGCRYKDVGHPFAPAVYSFGILLQKQLEDLGFYDPEVKLGLLQYVRRHGTDSILVRMWYPEHDHHLEGVT